MLASTLAVRRRVSAAAGGKRRLMVGFRVGVAVTPAARAFEDRHPDVVVDVQRIEGDDQAAMLLDGRIDVGYVRLPIDETGLRVTPLYAEPRVAVLPARHRLVSKEQVTEADLTDEPLVWHGDPSTQPTKRPLPNAGYPVRGVDETLEHVAARPGYLLPGAFGVGVLLASGRRLCAHPGPDSRPGVPRGGGIAHLADSG